MPLLVGAGGVGGVAPPPKRLAFPPPKPMNFAGVGAGAGFTMAAPKTPMAMKGSSPLRSPLGLSSSSSSGSSGAGTSPGLGGSSPSPAKADKPGVAKIQPDFDKGKKLSERLATMSEEEATSVASAFGCSVHNLRVQRY